MDYKIVTITYEEAESSDLCNLTRRLECEALETQNIAINLISDIPSKEIIEALDNLYTMLKETDGTLAIVGASEMAKSKLRRKLNHVPLYRNKEAYIGALEKGDLF